MPELIDRQSALSVCKEYGWIDDEDFIEGYNTAIKDIREAIKELPTIEAEPVRHGRWKKKNGEIYCTNCKKSKWSKSFELMLRGFDFCPKCGADMREGGADNDSE